MQTIKKIIYFIIFTFIYELSATDGIIQDYLVNDLCTKLDANGMKERVFTLRTKGREGIKGIILHNTVCQSLKETIKTYYDNGVSAHYTIDIDGTIYCHVKPENKAFHAGRSQFRAMTSLNEEFIGIEYVNPGYVEEGKTYYTSWGPTFNIQGDERNWFYLSQKQLEANGRLLNYLQKEYAIPGWRILSHSDISIGIKFDITPTYSYKQAFEQYEVGYYPKELDINLNDFKDLNDYHYLNLIHLYGYKSFDENAKNEIKAFQMHFSNSNISGVISEETKKDILNLCIDYSEYNDRYCGIDEKFKKEFREWIRGNKERTKGFEKYLRKI